jgi:hypothetical protein
MKNWIKSFSQKDIGNLVTFSTVRTLFFDDIYLEETKAKAKAKTTKNEKTKKRKRLKNDEQRTDQERTREKQH